MTRYIIACAALLAALAAGYRWSYNQGANDAHAEIQASIEKTRKENEVKIENAKQEHEKTLSRITADNARATTELERLRYAIRNQPTNASGGNGAATGELLAECSQAYTDVAREADGHAADSLMLQNAWPK